LAVGITHVRRGNDVGAVRLLTRGADRIEPYAAAAPYGVAVAGLTTWACGLVARIEQHGTEVSEEQLAPQLVGRAAAQPPAS
jgi:hypothetical protein